MSNSDLPAPEDILGRLLANRYLVEDPIERTPTSASYRAYHLAFDRSVLLRVLTPRSGLTRDACRRALAIAERASHEKSPHVARTLDIGLIAGRWPFVIFEYSKGHSLEVVLEEAGPLGPKRLLPIARQLASSLEAAHAAGVTHGGLTLDSAWLESPTGCSERLRTMGFGLSALPACEFEGATSGVFSSALGRAYDATGLPELRPVAIRSDIHALGMSLYELVSGARPLWTGNEVAGILDSDFARDVWVGHRALTRALAMIIQRCLYLLPDTNYVSALDVCRDLERLENVAATVVPEAKRQGPPVTAVHVPAPIRRVSVAGPKVIVRGG